MLTAVRVFAIIGYLTFGKARLSGTLGDSDLTHVVVDLDDLSHLDKIRSELSR